MIQRYKKGFTLIELMLAMTFVSILLIAIAMLTIYISTIYTKGITLREVNQAGLSISNDIQRSIASSTPFEVNDESSKRFLQTQTGGRLCLDRYSYAWNYAEAIHNPNTVFNKYPAGSGKRDTIIRFAKILDDGSLCQKNEAGAYKDIPFGDQTREMLASGDRDLAIHDFQLVSGDIDRPLYAISLVIGTNISGSIDGTKDRCSPPDELQGAQDYCSINRFDIIARAGSR